jgi:hypothetical protein
MQKRKSVPGVATKALLVNDQNSSRLNNTTLNESMNRKHLNSSGKSKERKPKVAIKKKALEKPT